MSKTDMPAAEASEATRYELAFHVLPTVAEGEVPAVFEKLKTALTKAGAEIFAEEAPERFDLAYDIVEYLEGRNRKFSSAYFGWVRFTAQPEAVEAITEVVEGTKELLRHLMIKLTKVEEANPFRFHEALEIKREETIEEDAPAKEAKPAEESKEEAEETPATKETSDEDKDADTEDSGEESK
jgi:ribosomal protein S6